MINRYIQGDKWAYFWRENGEELVKKYKLVFTPMITVACLATKGSKNLAGIAHGTLAETAKGSRAFHWTKAVFHKLHLKPDIRNS